MITVCEICRPNWDTVEEKTVPAILPCGLCGGEGPRHVLARDPGPVQQQEAAGS